MQRVLPKVSAWPRVIAFSHRVCAVQLAAKYGFDFELVTYIWPRWLRRQTEKQRVIWGYKILFLDVLFPLDVERVIFVDADQIVRDDLNKLHALDLEGATYAFTPFCSLPSNRRIETKGSLPCLLLLCGSWSSLGTKGFASGSRATGRRRWARSLTTLAVLAPLFCLAVLVCGSCPRHAALFVVDLKRFRQQVGLVPLSLGVAHFVAQAAGDILRGSYHQLSADPNSLSNLDQDLPNVLQSRLPIFSLPEEWLWCETWCTGEWRVGAAHQPTRCAFQTKASPRPSPSICARTR